MHKKRILEHLYRNYKMETAKVYTTDDESFKRHRMPPPPTYIQPICSILTVRNCR